MIRVNNWFYVLLMQSMPLGAIAHLQRADPQGRAWLTHGKCRGEGLLCREEFSIQLTHSKPYTPCVVWMIKPSLIEAVL